MPETSRTARFDQIVAPHLGAAYNLARWLVRNDHEAEDMVQEACLRAFHSIDAFRGEDSRPWILAIVRNTCYTFLRKRGSPELTTPFDESLHSNLREMAADPEKVQIRLQDTEELRRALEELPAEYREILILRELEGLSYREIAEVIDVPAGTVMSRLARARKRLESIVKGEASWTARKPAC